MDRFEETKLRVKEATDLVALIESYLPLKPRGRTLVALCPFHAESTPSFTVFRDTQHFRCFGCGKTGDVFTWLMERDGLSFREAMEQLADRAGVPTAGVFRGGRERDQAAATTGYQALAEVAGFFQRMLLEPEQGRAARRYLEQRGLDAAIGPWRLGYHPGPGALVQFARDHKLPVDVLEQAGLLRNGREPFAWRVMFPIDDERGRTVGFGGRILPDSPGAAGRGDHQPPKYLNSPESPLFHKRRVLFGLSRVKQAGQRRLVVMEGYTDVIACHLAGFDGAVAALGTAFTAEHARTLERYATGGLVLMFDGDRAGLAAAGRAMRELVNSRLPVRIALVGDGAAGAKDPADIVVARPGEDPELVGERRQRFADLIDGAEDALSVWFRLLRRRLDLDEPANLEAAARECAALVAAVEEPLRRTALVDRMARHLAVPAVHLERLVARRARPEPRGAAAPAPAPAASAGSSLLERAEHDLLACVLAQPELLVDLDLQAEPPLCVAPVATLLAWAVDGLAVGRASTAELFRYLFARAAEQTDLQEVLGTAHQRAIKLQAPAELLAGVLAGRRRRAGEAEHRRLRRHWQQAVATGDHAAAAAWQARLLERLRQDRPRPTSELPRPVGRAAGLEEPPRPADDPALGT